MRKVLILASLLATTLVAGCSSSRIPGIYRLDVQQGNVVTQDQLARLEPGMEQRKVRFILGSPMLVDVFNEQRWDYLYEYRPGGLGDPVRRRIALYFEGELLARIDGELLDAPTGDPDARDRVVTVPDRPRETGFFSAINPFSDDPYYKATDDSEPADAVTDATEVQPAPAPIEETQPVIEEAAAEQLPPKAVADASAESETAEDGGFFRRLAERFGFGDDEPPGPQPDPAIDAQ